MEYSEKVIDHYTNPRNVGKIEGASGVGEVGNPVCGDIMKMFLQIDDAEVITGTIESVCEPSKRVPTYKGDVPQTGKTVHGADIVIDGKEYLSGSCVGFKEGDCVSITYLPRSRFILSISALDNECDQ